MCYNDLRVWITIRYIKITMESRNNYSINAIDTHQLECIALQLKTCEVVNIIDSKGFNVSEFTKHLFCD